ncbi:CobW family GTP-binding protein [Aestuariivirga litoralis]|uniref:CobW family GTP-binding protein n=1 Tax=Aestuariivirga litoralis TaxID=2650924 RepID=UPI0018C5ADEF|nr:GTP-binding protein [Aestuariivirga litoralis]MBG1231055.1 GTP-binding protein [Aestuariivirga litoralis]
MASKPNHRSRIPVTLVTGFLGSGKTTLINAGLKSPDLARTVVVVNEFGEVGLDHQLYTSSNDAVVVLENGCLCCTVRSDLISTMNSLYHDRARGDLPSFDNVVIETTGLAEPGPILQAFLSEPTLDGLYRVARVLTVVDAVNWPTTAGRHTEALRQVALADDLLISKLDLAAEGTLVQLTKELQAINPAAAIAPADFRTASVAPLLMNPGFDAADPMADPSSWLSLANYEAYEERPDLSEGLQDQNLSHDLTAKGIESFVLQRAKPLSRDELQFLLDGISQNLGPSLLRVKGLINIREEPGRPAIIQGVQHLLHNVTWLEKWPSADERTRVVFITQGVARSELKEIIELLDRMSARTFLAREKAATSQAVAETTAS